MADNATRIIGFSCVLVGVWIVAYWLWRPMGARIVVDERPGVLSPADTDAAASEPAAAPAIKPPDGPPHDGTNEQTRSETRLLAPQFRDYVVQEGDTSFEKVAARPEVFGDPRKGEVIARSNKFADPTKLKPGLTVLRIPLDPENVEGKLVQVLQVPGEPPTVVPGAPPVPAAPDAGTAAGTQTYTLKQGDTLWEVSKKFYGKGALWKVIADANRDVLPKPERPPVGVTIRIPPPPAPSSGPEPKTTR